MDQLNSKEIEVAQQVPLEDPRPIVMGDVDLKPLIIAAVTVLGIIAFIAVAVLEVYKNFTGAH